MDTDSDGRRYRVVRNAEEQYSIWPADQAIPEGWRADGMVGTRQECLEWIDEVWTDMRPLRARGGR